MKKFLAFIFLFAAGSLQAQTTAENIESAVKIYNGMRDYEDNLKPGSVNQEDIDKLKTDMNSGIGYLEAAKKDASAADLDVIRYFTANFRYDEFSMNS